VPAKLASSQAAADVSHGQRVVVRVLRARRRSTAASAAAGSRTWLAHHLVLL